MKEDQRVVIFYDHIRRRRGFRARHRGRAQQEEEKREHRRQVSELLGRGEKERDLAPRALYTETRPHSLAQEFSSSQSLECFESTMVLTMHRGRERGEQFRGMADARV